MRSIADRNVVLRRILVLWHIEEYLKRPSLCCCLKRPSSHCWVIRPSWYYWFVCNSMMISEKLNGWRVNLIDREYNKNSSVGLNLQCLSNKQNCIYWKRSGRAGDMGEPVTSSGCLQRAGVGGKKKIRFRSYQYFLYFHSFWKFYVSFVIDNQQDATFWFMYLYPLSSICFGRWVPPRTWDRQAAT